MSTDRAGLSSLLWLWVLLSESSTGHASGAAECNGTAMTSEERRHLRCYLKGMLFNEGKGRYCCLPTEAKSRTCAVISNSGVLLNYRLGSQIDRHPYVIRLNNAPISPFENHVGAKVSYRFGWNSHGVRPTDHMQNFDETYSVCDEAESSKMERLLPDAHLHVFYCEGGIVKRVINTLYPGLLGWTRARHLPNRNADPTTGASAILLAMSSCERVFVYGMTPSRYDAASRFHYYGKLSKLRRVRSNHHLTWRAEHDLWMRLSDLPTDDIYRNGYVSISGFGDLDNCSEIMLHEHPGFNRTWFEDMKCAFSAPPSKQIPDLLANMAWFAGHIGLQPSPGPRGVKSSNSSSSDTSVHEHETMDLWFLICLTCSVQFLCLAFMFYRSCRSRKRFIGIA